MKRQSCVCGEIVYCGVVLLVNEVRSGGEEKHNRYQWSGHVMVYK